MSNNKRCLQVSSQPGRHVFLPLLQMEQENQQLKMANLKQTEQIMLLQDKLQGGHSSRAKSDSSTRETAPFSVLLIIFWNTIPILRICRTVSCSHFDLFGFPFLTLVRSTSGESLWISRHLSCSGYTLSAQQSALSSQLPRHAACSG